LKPIIDPLLCLFLNAVAVVNWAVAVVNWAVAVVNSAVTVVGLDVAVVDWSAAVRVNRGPRLCWEVVRIGRR